MHAIHEPVVMDLRSRVYDPASARTTVVGELNFFPSSDRLFVGLTQFSASFPVLGQLPPPSRFRRHKPSSLRIQNLSQCPVHTRTYMSARPLSVVITLSAVVLMYYVAATRFSAVVSGCRSHKAHRRKRITICRLQTTAD